MKYIRFEYLCLLYSIFQIMKKIFLAVVVFASLVACNKSTPEQIKTPSENTEKMIPEKTTASTFGLDALNEKLKSIDGKTVSLKEVLNQHKGKPILIDVWASWCPDCIEGMPKLHELQKQYDLVYLFLSYDKTEEAWKEGIEKHKTIGENFLIQSAWKDGDFRKAIELDWIPRYILVDQEGNIAHFRAIEADDIELITKIKSLTK